MPGRTQKLAAGPPGRASTLDSLAAAGWVRGPRSADVGRELLVWQLYREGWAQTVLLWRTRRGTPVAIDNQCPHRGYAMNDARVVGDAVECPVHGYLFGPGGRCVNVRRAPMASTVELCEVDGWVWFAP